MKPLIPSHKENKRYLLVNGKVDEVETAILDFIGVFGMSKTGLGWIKKEKESAVIAVNREAVDSVRASFAVWPHAISVKRVSGTMKGLNTR